VALELNIIEELLVTFLRVEYINIISGKINKKFTVYHNANSRKEKIETAFLGYSMHTSRATALDFLAS